MAIKIVKIGTGEDIIADVETDDTKDHFNRTGITLKHPVNLVFTPEGLAMVPLMPFAKHKDNKIIITEKDIVMVTDAETDLENEYREKFGSGISVTNMNLIQ